MCRAATLSGLLEKTLHYISERKCKTKRSMRRRVPLGLDHKRTNFSSAAESGMDTYDLGLEVVEHVRLGEFTRIPTLNHPHLHRSRSSTFSDSHFERGCIRKFISKL